MKRPVFLAIMLLIPATTFSQPVLNVQDNGINASSNREWLVTIAPDTALFTNTPGGFGGSLATELAFEVTGSIFLGASKNGTDWAFDNPGNDPFTSGVSFGIDVTDTTLFAAIGSNLFTTGAAVDALVIETAGSAPTTVTWGGHTLLPGTPNEFVGSRIAQGADNFDGYQGSLTLGSGGLLCDFDNSGVCDLDDIDALNNDIAAGNNTASFDLTGDNVVDRDDQTEWLSLAGETNIGPGRAYLPGDANLDTVVDASDFNVWNSFKFTSTANWSEGDFTADGVTDASDFNVWNGNKFTASDITAVPEPGALSLIWIAFPGLFLARRRSR